MFIFCDYFYPAYKAGGPIKSISNLIGNFSDKVDFYIITRPNDLGDKRILPNIIINAFHKKNNYNIIYLQKSIFGRIMFLLSLKVSINDIFFFNSFFSLQYTIIPILTIHFLRRLNNKTILAVRGEHSKAAKNIKRFKKNFYLLIANWLHLYRKVIFLASSLSEKKDINSTIKKHYGIVIIPPLINNTLAFHNNVVKKRNNPIKLVFLSRIAPIKNLDFAIKILNEVKFSFIFDIFGPIEDKKYFDKCFSLINDNKTPYVKYCGVVEGDKVNEVFIEHDFLFLPTKSENFGHVIYEALSIGCPVIISDQTPWQNLEEKKIGWDISLNSPQKFIDVLDRVACMSQSEYQELSTNSIKFARIYSEGQIKETNLIFSELFEI